MNFPLQTNFSNICRTCLSENLSMKSVFSYEQIMEQKVMLCDMLMSCASVLVLHGDGLPENLCLNCSQQINTAYLFRKLCERSDATLRECTAITGLNSDHVFSIQIEDKFDLALDDKSLNQGGNTDYKEANGASISKQPEQSDDSDGNGNETTETNNDNLCLESFITNKSEINGDKVFRCQQCNKEFCEKTHLIRHKSMHDDSVETEQHNNKNCLEKKRNQSRTCEICNKTFRFHSNLERHKLIHTGEKPFLCNVCGKGFAQMAYLKIHSFIHTGEKPYKCQMCDRSFAAPGTLMTHIRTHTGERPHICKICGKDFPQSGYLSAHIRTHTGEKPIECKVCNRRFNQSGRLIVHMRIHSGEKPYQCTMCDRSFAVKGTLKKHIRTHTGERPYKCEVCGQTFAQSGTLSTHMKVHKSKADEEKLIPWT